MTEAEWLVCADPQPMLEFLKGKVSHRKLRLFACAFFRAMYASTDSRQAIISIGESHADGAVSQESLRAAQAQAIGLGAKQAVWVVVSNNISQSLMSVLTHEFSCIFGPKQSARFWIPLQEILGNPFRPVVVAPSWLTSTVLVIARHIYESRDFSLMPILADALQDAGCENVNILNHCREPSDHVRGCWLVDQILGFS